MRPSLAIVSLVLLCGGCPRKEESPRPNHSTTFHGAPQPVTREEAPPPAAPVTRNAAGPAGVPRRMPTIASIDWAAFPDEKSPKIGGSGRRITVRPGKPGVIARALSRARAWDTILLHGGTYREGS